MIGGAKTVERRYFISSLGANAREALRCVRGHWAIENELHWCLDIGFREDESRVREAKSAENLATVRHIGLNLLKQEESCQLGIKSKRKKAGWDENYLLKVLKKCCVRPSNYCLFPFVISFRACIFNTPRSSVYARKLNFVMDLSRIALTEKIFSSLRC